jgi:cytochrome b
MTENTSGSESRNILLWDLPLRIFHWALALLVSGALYSGWQGGNLIIWHERFGVAILGLLAFRVAWGFVGPQTARFTHFIKGPAAIRAYLRGEWQGIGHNPLGALSVMGMIGVFGAQALGGLFSNDDIAFEGPLISLVDKSLSDWITGVHGSMLWWLLALIGLHVGAVLFYTRVKKENLLRPMLTGRKTVPVKQAKILQEQPGVRWWALLLAVAFGLLVAWLASGAWLPAPPPPPPPPAW